MHYTIWDTAQEHIHATFSGGRALEQAVAWLVRNGVVELKGLSEEEAYNTLFGGKEFVEHGDPDKYVDPPGLDRFIIEETYGGRFG
jgi:hypothetical protein